MGFPRDIRRRPCTVQPAWLRNAPPKINLWPFGLLAFWAYGAAVLTGYSRIDADRHDLTQVVAGLLVGYFANGFSLSA